MDPVQKNAGPEGPASQLGKLFVRETKGPRTHSLSIAPRQCVNLVKFSRADLIQIKSAELIHADARIGTVRVFRDDR